MGSEAPRAALEGGLWGRWRAAPGRVQDCTLLEKPELRGLFEVQTLRQLQLSAVEARASYLRAVEAVACRVRSDLQRGAWRGMTFGGGPPASGFEAPTARIVTFIGRSLSIVEKKKMEMGIDIQLFEACTYLTALLSKQPSVAFLAPALRTCHSTVPPHRPLP